MLDIRGTTILLTRGDTLMTEVEMIDDEGRTVDPDPGDQILFTLKRGVMDGAEILMVKEIDDMTLILSPEDTAELPSGTYAFDISRLHDGARDTFINNGFLILDTGGADGCTEDSADQQG